MERKFHPLKTEQTINITEVHLEPSQSSKMELCAKIVNDFQLLNIFAKKLDLRYFSGFWISLYFIQYTRDDKKNLNVLFKMIFWNLSLWLLEDLYWIYASALLNLLIPICLSLWWNHKWSFKLFAFIIHYSWNCCLGCQ